MSNAEQMAAAPLDRTVLGEYRGKDIIRTSVAIQKTGDGLSESMSIDPQILEIDETGYALIEYEVDHHEPKRIPGTECLELKQVLHAKTVTIVDEDYAAERIESQKAKNQRAKDARKQQGSIDTTLLETQHNDGNHASGLVDGCPICDTERQAEADEKAEK